MKKLIPVLCILSVWMLSTAFHGVEENTHAGGDKARELVRKADSLRREYHFLEALQLYRTASDIVVRRNIPADSLQIEPQDSVLSVSGPDSVLMEQIDSRRVMAENGMAMKQYVSEPAVVARHRFAVKDFYLYYPMEDRSWRPVPNQLDSTAGHEYVNATYVPDGTTEIYFSAADSEGARNICRTQFRDTVWTAPEIVDERLTSSGDEIFPVLSSDGQTLYFASSGLYGAGGYDLYKSEWDSESGSWGIPENLGFPYSSPYDDLLFFNTGDGKYSIFASTRDCPEDSITVYVVEYDSMPVRRQVEDPEEIKSIAALAPLDDLSRMDTAGPAAADGVQDGTDISRYILKVKEVRALQDSVAEYGSRLDTMRGILEHSPDREERESLAADILEREARVPVLQDSLDRALKTLQAIEMEFLFNGVVIDPDKVMSQADKEEAGISENYVFTRLEPGDSLSIRIEEPEEEFDYSFMILPEGRFAQDNTIPSGLVYQIQMFLLSEPATVAQIKGLSPVFEEKTPTGKYIYRVGVFRSYNDVLSNLNKVKKLGFKTAFIAAFMDGKPLQVQKARALEAELQKSASYQVRISSAGEALPEMTLKAIRQVTDRDIARVVEDGSTYFVVGPMSTEGEADKVAEMVRISGGGEASVIKVGN